MHSFSVEVSWEVDGAERQLYVVGWTVPPSPGNRRGHPDTWTPGYDREITDVRIADAATHIVDPGLTARLVDDDVFMDQIARQLEEKNPA